MKRARGILLLDAALGLVILVSLSVLVGVMIGQSQRQLGKLEDHRQAVAKAQQILADLQMGAPGEWAAQVGRSVYIDPLLADAPAPGKLWVQVEVTHKKQTARLSGVVPALVMRQIGGGRP